MLLPPFPFACLNQNTKTHTKNIIDVQHNTQQVVEGSLSGLEAAQSEGLRRLGGSISSSLIDAESALQVGLKV